VSAVDAFWMRQAALDSLRHPSWARFAETFTTSLVQSAVGLNAHASWEGDGRALTEHAHTALTLAESYYVAPQMHALVTAAAESWPEDEAVHEEDFPTDHGWMWLPGKGLAIIDVRGTALHVNGITWARSGSDVTVAWWGHKKHDPPHLVDKGGWDLIPDLSPWHVGLLRLDKPLPTTIQMGTVLPPEVSQQIRYHDTPQGLSMSFPLGWSPEQLQPRLAVDPIAAWLVSALRIMQQPLAEVTRHGLPANVRRQHAKRPHRLRQTAVTVIDFRRVEGDYHEGSGRTYSHRFLRRGHWRRQPYKRDDGTWDRRRIWIHPTIVGDPDKPLILRNHVSALMR